MEATNSAQTIRLLVGTTTPAHAETLHDTLSLVQGFTFTIDLAQSIEEIEKKVAETPYDLLFVDREVGGQDGLELVRSLRVKDKPISVIVMAEQADAKLAIEAVQVGADDFISYGELTSLGLLKQILSAIEKNTLRLKQKQAEWQLQQAERITALGSMVSSIAHEINNPLTTILGYAELLRDQPQTNSYIKERLERVCIEAERCKKIISSLLSFVRSSKAERKYVGVNGLIAKTVKLLEHQFAIHNIQLECRYEEGLPRTTVDFHQIQQVVFNLLRNAYQTLIHWEGEKRVILRTYSRQSNIYIEIRDSGPEIPKQDLSHLFEPFSSSQPLSEVGIGLGLSVAYNLVKAHNGNLTVQSEEGKGTTFTVELPIVREETAEADMRVLAQTQTVPALKILAIDDEPMILELYREVFKEQGHEVDLARNGREALEKISVNPDSYKVIFTDVKMPEMNGQEFFDEVNRRYPHLAQRVVFVSGYVPSGEASEAVYNAKNRILYKPFSIKDLDIAIRKVIHAF